MCSAENNPEVLQAPEASKEELRAQGRRRAALKFKRAKAEYVSPEEWEQCLADPLKAKTPDWIVCLVCRQKCQTLGLHLKPHNVSPEWYREIFGYEPGEALICDALAERCGRLPKDTLRLSDDEIAQCVRDPLKTKTIRGAKWIACIAGGECGMLFRQITPSHLRQHSLSKRAYLDQLEWNYQQTLVSDEMTKELKARAAVSKTLIYGKRGVAPPPRIHRKGRTMSKAWRRKQSERMRGKKRPDKRVKRGSGKRTPDLLVLCAAFEKVGKKVYSMAPVLYPLGPQRDQEGAEAATRLLRKRNREELDRLAASMSDPEARQRIAVAMQVRAAHP